MQVTPIKVNDALKDLQQKRSPIEFKMRQMQQLMAKPIFDINRPKPIFDYKRKFNDISNAQAQLQKIPDSLISQARTQIVTTEKDLQTIRKTNIKRRRTNVENIIEASPS
jgi:hypothetical protein